MGNGNDLDGYCRIPMTIAMKFSEFIDFDFVIKASDTRKFRIRHADGDIFERLSAYSKKGIQEIYVSNEQLQEFTEKIHQSFPEKLKNQPADFKNESVEMLNAGYELVKELLLVVGITEATAKLVHEIGRASCEFIADVPNVFKFLKRFRNNCNDAYLNNLMISYVATTILNDFDWATQQIKEKMFTAAVLCDITMEKGDYEILKNHEGSPKDLPERIYNHPLLTAKLLSKHKQSYIPPEVLSIVELHHENASGTGFPGSVSAPAIPILPAIYIVAANFCEEAEKGDYSFEGINNCLSDLEQKYKIGNFKKAKTALKNVLHICPELT